jgi:gliding motility-associated-like protein
MIAKPIIAQQGFVNNGAKVDIESGAYINIIGDFTNNTVASIDGQIDIDGNLVVKTGNFTNNSNGNVFTNIDPIPDGNIVLDSIIPQSIQGTGSPIFFENLKIKNSTKTLDLNNCEVKGILTEDAILDLNRNRLIIDNKNPISITYLSGYILSETLPPNLGEIEWKIGDATATYAIPFGTGNSTDNDLNLILQTKTSASPSTGSIVFATYPTDASNDPYPSGIASLDGKNPIDLADRYWELEPNFTSKPDISITFKYTQPDVDLTDNPGLIEVNLKAIRFNDVSNTWLDMNKTGLCNIADKTVTADIVNTNFFTYWALNEFDLKIPNAFTPDKDGTNDVFLKGYKVKIVNRWGQLLYKGNDGWDGSLDNGKKASPGTYYYIATIPDTDNGTKDVTGVITLVVK